MVATNQDLGQINAESFLGVVHDAGMAPVGYFYLTGSVSDTEVVTVADESSTARTYEFDTDSTITGDVTVDVSGDATADAAITALVSAVNGDSARVVNAVAMAGNSDTTAGCVLVGRAQTSTNFAITTDAANGVVSAATMTGGADIQDRREFHGQYTVTSADVTMWARTGANEVPIAGVPTSTQPTLTSLLLQDSSGTVASPATVVAKWTQVNSAFYTLIIEDPSAVLANTDTIQWKAMV